MTLTSSPKKATGEINRERCKCHRLPRLPRFSLGEYDLGIAALERRLKRNPELGTAFVLLACCFGWLGRSEDARMAWDQALRINPGFSIERSRGVLPFRNPEDFERRAEGLRRAGLNF